MSAPPAALPAFDVFEKSIQELQVAQEQGLTNARDLVTQYLARIQAYDQRGPAINAIVTLNPRALEQADALDEERRRRGPRGPLHGIPILVKDNFETHDMPTSGGTLVLAGFRPEEDAHQVAKLRDAGAIILGKTTLHELSAGITTISSLSGQTRNPYDLARVPGGSSGGTAAAVAASFSAAGMGSDTCGSIRIPAAHQNLVGLRVTQGLSGRSGMIPLSTTQDEAGPIARCVSDVAIMLDATAGPDPRDPASRDAAQHLPPSFLHSLHHATLTGRRLGVLQSLFGSALEDAEVAGIVRAALSRMQCMGAELVHVEIKDLQELLDTGDVIAHEFKFALSDYLTSRPKAPLRSLQELIDNGWHHRDLTEIFHRRNQALSRDSEAYRNAKATRLILHQRVISLLESQKLDALAFPVLRRKAALIGQPQEGWNSQLSAYTGLPAISLPAGFTPDGIPVGMELLARPYAEASLLQIALSVEKQANMRRPPCSTPPLVNGTAPRPGTFEAHIDASRAGGPSVHAVFRYDAPSSQLQCTATVQGASSDEVLGLTLINRTVINHLLRQGQMRSVTTTRLDARDREALLGGDLHMQLHTTQYPCGAFRSQIRLP